MEKSGEGKGGGAGEYSEELREEMIHYFGLAVREYFLVEEISFKNDMVVLEVGVGSGKAIELLKGRVREFWGVDKSVELIELLKEEYGLCSENRGRCVEREKNDEGGEIEESRRYKSESGEKSGRGGGDLVRAGEQGKERVREEERSGDRQNLAEVKLICLDVCEEHASLGKKFDVIFSLDTLEHVDYPERFFSFVARHLKRREEGDGLGVIIFPNECQERHHGVMWFGDKGELVRLIGKAGLEVSELKELQMTSWHRVIKKLFWEGPKEVVIRLGGWRKNLACHPHSSPLGNFQKHSIPASGGALRTKVEP